MKKYLPLAAAIALTACEKPGSAPTTGTPPAQQMTPGTPAETATEEPAPAGPSSESKPRPKTQSPQKAVPSHPVAEAVPGQTGFVLSPHNRSVVDVRGLPPGTLVQDPGFPASEKKYFRVPE